MKSFFYVDSKDYYMKTAKIWDLKTCLPIKKMFDKSKQIRIKLFFMLILKITICDTQFLKIDTSKNLELRNIFSGVEKRLFVDVYH